MFDLLTFLCDIFRWKSDRVTLWADDTRVLTPKFGVTTLHKDRLLGHRAECTGKIGHVTTFEERIRDLRKALRDHIYMKTKTNREGWRWFDPDALGYIDVQSLYCVTQEFMIDCTMDECIALHKILDLDGPLPELPHIHSLPWLMRLACLCCSSV